MAATELTTAEQYCQQLLGDIDDVLKKYRQAHELADSIIITFDGMKHKVTVKPKVYA